MTVTCPSCDQSHSDKQPHHCITDPFTPGLFRRRTFDPGPPLASLAAVRALQPRCRCGLSGAHQGECEPVEVEP